MIEFQVFVTALQTVIRYLSAFPTSDVVFDNVGIGPYVTDITMSISGEPTVTEETKKEASDYISAWRTILDYIWQQKESVLTITGFIIGEVVIANFTAEWNNGPVWQVVTIAYFDANITNGALFQEFSTGDTQIKKKVEE